VSDYLAMKNLALPLNEWTELRIETLEKLTRDKHFVLLVGIYLEEGEIDRALEKLEQRCALSRYRWEYPYSLELEEAKEAEKNRPEQAIRLYLNQINSLIDQLGRGNYAEAAAYLKVARGLYHPLGKQDD
jgi:uncharacterized Zn finger protein